MTQVKDSLIWCPRELLIGRQVILHLMMACLRGCADLASQVVSKILIHLYLQIAGNMAHIYVPSSIDLSKTYGSSLSNHAAKQFTSTAPTTALHFTTLFMRKKKCYGNWQNSTMMSNLLLCSLSYNHDKVRSIFRNTKSKKKIIQSATDQPPKNPRPKMNWNTNGNLLRSGHC